MALVTIKSVGLSNLRDDWIVRPLPRRAGADCTFVGHQRVQLGRAGSRVLVLLQDRARYASPAAQQRRRRRPDRSDVRVPHRVLLLTTQDRVPEEEGQARANHFQEGRDGQEERRVQEPCGDGVHGRTRKQHVHAARTTEAPARAEHQALACRRSLIRASFSFSTAGLIIEQKVKPVARALPRSQPLPASGASSAVPRAPVTLGGAAPRAPAAPGKVVLNRAPAAPTANGPGRAAPPPPSRAPMPPPPPPEPEVEMYKACVLLRTASFADVGSQTLYVRDGSAGGDGVGQGRAGRGCAEGRSRYVPR